MGAFGSKKDKQDLEEEIEKKLEKELENYVEDEMKKLEKIAKENGVPEEDANKIIKETREKAIKEVRKEIKDNRNELVEEIKEDLKKDPILWCPNDDKSGCTVFPRSEKPTNCFGYFTKDQCEERSGLKKKNLPSFSNLYSQKKNLSKGSLRLNEPMVWCPNKEKTSCVSSPRSKKPIGCIGDFSKDQCEMSRLKKVRKQNLPNVNNLVTQRTHLRNTGFRRQAPKAWCPKFEKGKAVCEYRTIDSTCKPPSFSEQQCLDKFPCQLIKTYQGSDKEKLKNICRSTGDTKMMCLQDTAQINAKELGAHCVWEGEVCLPNKDLLNTAIKEGVNSISERQYIEMCKGHSLNKNKCEDNHENYHKLVRRPFKNNESNLCKTFYN